MFQFAAVVVVVAERLDKRNTDDMKGQEPDLRRQMESRINTKAAFRLQTDLI